jgi:transcription elongation GreA/GreB family factor
MTPTPKPITSIGLEIFREEFRQKQIERHFWVGEKERAAALGDRSENAEYISAKEMIRNLDKRLRFLQNIVQNSRVIDPNSISNNDLRFGKKVIFDDGSFLCLVGSYELSLFVNAVSVYAPVGKQLLGKKVGEGIVLNKNKLKIISIESVTHHNIIDLN